MKFKQRHVQNQRVERITTDHLVIGVDIAKESHVARAVNFRGIELGGHLSFQNNVEGFEKLHRWIQALQSRHGLSSLILGLEPTGHYWFNLGSWLLGKKVEVVLVNPLTTNRNKENRDNSQSKSDLKDALVIADSVCRGFYSSFTQHGHIYQELRMVMNDREYWVENLTRLKNRTTRWLDIFFPEYSSIFKDWTCPRSIATLKAFPFPRQLQSMSAFDVIKGWREQGMQRAGGSSGIQKAAQLLAEARRSIGSTVGQQEAQSELHRLLDDYDRLVERLQEIEQQILTLLQEIPEMPDLLRSIKGLGTICIAAILAGAGDLRTYEHGQQILSHAGLNLADKSSGKYQGKIKLSKRGSRQLRKYLYLAVVQLVSNNPAFKEWHEHNVKVKKMKKHRSIFKLIGKLARTIIGMVRHNTRFSPFSEKGAVAA